MTRESQAILARVQRQPGASEDKIRACESALGLGLPLDYVAFLQLTNGCEGTLGDGAYVILWPAHELAPLHTAFEVAENASGLLPFGTNGGGEAFGFDTRVSPWTYIQVPFISMEWEAAVQLGSSFEEFLWTLTRGERG